MASLILSVPQLCLSLVEETPGKLVCREQRAEKYLIVLLGYHVPMFAVLCRLPLVILSFSYVKVSKQLYDVVGRYRQKSRFDICGAMTEMRRNIIRLLVVVFIVFVVCLTP